MTDTMRLDHGTSTQAPARNTAGAAAVARRLPPLMVTLFLLSMVVPVWLRLGGTLLMPHRVILVILFVPLVVQLLSGRAGRIGIFDVLMVFSTLWAVLSILVNVHFRGESKIEPIGIYVLEFFGAYLLGRVVIRSRDDFVAFVRMFFITLLILVPFAAAESILHRAIMLDLIPQSVQVVNTEPRWGLRRAQTVFGHPILFGVFSGIGFGLFWYVMRSRLTRIGGALLSFAGTFFSLSSGALVQITMQIIFIFWDSTTKRVPHRWRIFGFLAVFFYLAIDLLSNRTPFHVLITYATFNSGSSYNRILIWRFGMENVWANPWFGLGENVNNWVRPEWMSSSADNYWLVMAMKFGIPSFLAAALALFFIIRRVAQAPITDPLAQACRAGFLTTVGALIIAGGTVHFWHGVMAFVMFIFGSGVWIIQAGREDAAAPATDTDDGAPDDTPDPGGVVYTRQPARHSRTAAPPAAKTRARRGAASTDPPPARHTRKARD